jgi:hypothetical protein
MCNPDDLPVEQRVPEDKQKIYDMIEAGEIDAAIFRTLNLPHVCHVRDARASFRIMTERNNHHENSL